MPSQKYQRTVGYPSTSWASCLGLLLKIFIHHIIVIKPQLAIARLRLHASELSICFSVCLSVSLSFCRRNAKNAIFSITKQFRATVSIDHL